MNYFTKHSKIIFSLFLMVLASLLFFSCSRDVPNVLKTECSVIFTYEDDTSLPESRLSVFSMSESDVRRCDRIKIESLDSGYSWETKDIRKLSQGNYQWAGGMKFVPPEGEKIPCGRYEITYVNADGEQQVSYTNISYNQDIYNMNAKELVDFMESRGIYNIAVYDNSDVLLYVGEKTEELINNFDIINRYNGARYTRDIWTFADNSIICILPEQMLF